MVNIITKLKAQGIYMMLCADPNGIEIPNEAK